MSKPQLTHGSLFAGIGGFDLGFERAGFKTVWQVEIDEYCRRVLAKNFPDAERFGDVRDSGARNLSAVDVISGGFPCQDISLAGRRAGIDGERSGLWSEMWRVICELRPQFVLVENVAALLNGGMERVLGDLAAGGYSAEWDCIPACAVGAPHRRDRVWIVAYPESDLRRASGHDRHEPSDRSSADVGNAERTRLEGYAGNGNGNGRSLTPRPTSETSLRDGTPADVPDSESVRAQGRIFESGRRGFAGQNGDEGNLADSNLEPTLRPAIARYECNPWTVEPDVGRVAHGVPNRVDRLKGLGNAVVPQIAQWIAERIKAQIETETETQMGED